MNKSKMLKYSFFMMVPFVLCAACKRYEHKNVVTGVVPGDHSTVFLKDIETSEERIYIFDKSLYKQDGKPQYKDYIKIGDTVNVISSLENYYEDNLVLGHRTVRVEYNQDTVNARFERGKRKQFDMLKQQIEQQR